MALHISEIGVRVAVGDPGGGGSPVQRRAVDGDGCGGGGVLSGAELDAIVRQTTARVLETLRLREAR